ncbi:TPA: hypothetical protein RTV06_002709 [Staphylococcus aureus]|uniref:hypothetical protein n=1 Tax=Staphylococcus capitis TaxID=29388 RepID=UPI00064A13CF|nr:hypothetical protein [Staphylococcus capitis]AKL93506.1 hypothetical protein AYP1020_p51 [Staphylococcus capitis subsp. capitis]HDZ6149464.1 hypothetical protein [Staphylococcus aureus]HDZ6149767.1 hypothetical protein [Staphylococcus aureus]
MNGKNVGKFLLIALCVLALSWFTSSLLGINSQLFGELYDKFAKTNLINPFRFYILTVGIGLSLAIIISIVLVSLNSVIAKVILRIILTGFVLYVIFIGPLIMISFMILINVNFVQISIVFAIMSFIGVCYKKAKNLAKDIYEFFKRNDNY